MSRLRNLAVLGTSLSLLGGCGSLIGLSDYEIDESLDEPSGGDGDGDMATGDGDMMTGDGDGDIGGSSSGGSSSGGGSSGGSGTGGAPDECDESCDDGNECTTDACVDGECAHTTLDAGEACSGGVCNGVTGDAACVRCVDDVPANMTDSGCSDGAPQCDEAGTPICTGCQEHADCDDGNECTVDSCNGDGECVITSVDAGTLCTEGVCNGVQGTEVCRPCIDDAMGADMDSGCDAGTPICDTDGANVCVECIDDAAGTNEDSGCGGSTPICEGGACVECVSNGQCDDSIDCTVDSCNAGVCEHTGDDSVCSYNSGTGKCGSCNPATGCEDGADPTVGDELLTNGNFDTGSIGWTQSSTCCGMGGIIWPYTILDDPDDTPPFVFQRHSVDPDDPLEQFAWMGGDDSEVSFLTQSGLAFSAETVGLRVTTHVYSETWELNDDDFMRLTVRNNTDSESELLRTWFSEDTFGWTGPFVDDVDVSDWSGSSLTVEYESIIDAHTGPVRNDSSFFLDTLSVRPLVCE